MGFIDDEDRIICKVCNRVVIAVIPMYDNDQAHKNLLCCRDCKKKIKDGTDIIKFKRDPAELKAIKRESDRKAGLREVIEPK